LRDKVLRRPDGTQCAIPNGIFAAPDGSAPGRRGEDAGAMLRMIAYGGESHFAHPPRPADPKAVWTPEWSVRVRVKSHTLATLGEESAGRAAASGRNTPIPAGQESAPGSAESVIPLPGPVNILRGIFGR
jgi:hypothetical protein